VPGRQSVQVARAGLLTIQESIQPVGKFENAAIEMKRFAQRLVSDQMRLRRRLGSLTPWQLASRRLHGPRPAGDQDRVREPKLEQCSVDSQLGVECLPYPKNCGQRGEEGATSRTMKQPVSHHLPPTLLGSGHLGAGSLDQRNQETHFIYF